MRRRDMAKIDRIECDECGAEIYRDSDGISVGIGATMHVQAFVNYITTLDFCDSKCAAKNFAKRAEIYYIAGGVPEGGCYTVKIEFYAADGELIRTKVDTVGNVHALRAAHQRQ
jgi:hypothetical protein